MKQDVTLSNQDFPDKYSKLQKYDRYEFNASKSQAIKVHFPAKTFEYTRFKSGRYEECTFDNCVFEAVGLSGTHFFSCDLDDCIFNDSNMQFCEFSRGSKLRGVNTTADISNSNLSQSMFCDCILENVRFKSTTISQARFINTTFRDVSWDSCTLQDDVFDNITMQDISLVGCNLEYSYFNNVTFKGEAALPFHQIPYAFGLLEYLRHYPDEIKVGSLSMEGELISAGEYMEVLPDLFAYYLDMEEYFPAINIALFYKEHERVEGLIDAGIQCYIHSNDFRKIKSICRLIANSPAYDRHYMTQLFFKLVEYYNIVGVSEYERYQYSLHINEIKKILTGFDDAVPTAQLYLKTNITSADVDKLGGFCHFMEECLGDYGISNEQYFLELRHNSDPISFWLMLSHASKEILLYAIGIIMSALTADPQFLQTALEIMANTATVGAFAMQIKEAWNGHKNAVTPNTQQMKSQDINYIKSKNQILKDKEISVELASPFFNFSYRKKTRHIH